MIFPFPTCVLTKEFNEIRDIAMETPIVKEKARDKKEVKRLCILALKVVQDSIMPKKFIVDFLKTNIQTIVDIFYKNHGWLWGGKEFEEKMVKDSIRRFLALKIYNEIDTEFDPLVW